MPDASQRKAATPEQGKQEIGTTLTKTPLLTDNRSDMEPVLKERKLVPGHVDKAEFQSPPTTENALPGKKRSGRFSVIEQTVFKARTFGIPGTVLPEAEKSVAKKR